MLSGYYNLKNDLERLAAASYCAELSDMLLEEGMGEGALYQLLGYTFLLLEKTTLSGVWTSTLAFVLKLLGLTGVYPILDKCAVCGKQAPRYYFDFSAGGLICGNCRDRDVVCPAISDKEASFLYGLLHLELKKLGELHSPEKKTQKYLLHQLNEYISYQYLKKSRSFGLLYSL